MSKLAVFDVDGTLREGFLIFEVVRAANSESKHLFPDDELGKIMHVGAEYKKDPVKYPYRQVVEDVVAAVSRGFAGKRRQDVEAVGRKYIGDNPGSTFDFTPGLIRLVREKGYKPVIVSGSLIEIVRPFCETIDADEDVYATTLETDDSGIYTGRVAQNCALHETKKAILRKYADNGADMEASAGFGDTDQDESFLEEVGYPVAINPNNKLIERAVRDSWLICNVGDDVVAKVNGYLP